MLLAFPLCPPWILPFLYELSDVLEIGLAKEFFLTEFVVVEELSDIPPSSAIKVFVSCDEDLLEGRVGLKWVSSELPLRVV